MALPLFKILRVSFYCIFHKAIQLNVILSEAKNLVVAPAQRLFHPHFTLHVCQTLPLQKMLALPQRLYRMDCQLACHSDVAPPRIILRLTRSIASTVRTTSLFVILSGAKNLVVAPARERPIYPSHRANISSFPQYIKSYLTKNACHSTTPIPQGNTIKCHSERSEESRRSHHPPAYV